MSYPRAVSSTQPVFNLPTNDPALGMPEDQPAAALDCAEHTPFIVITAAVGGTAAEVSAGAWPGCGGAGAPGMDCPQASVPNRTHISHLLRIRHFLQDWSFRKLKMPSIKS